MRAKKKAFELDDYERTIESSLDSGDWTEVAPEEIQRTVMAAQAFLEDQKKEARVNIRMSELDIEILKQKAAREGIGYQTLLSSVIHKFVTGQLMDRAAFDEVVAKIERKLKSKKRSA